MPKIINYFKSKFFIITFERFPNLFRPSSKPYISGDTFRKLSDHIFDESKTFNPKKVKYNDFVFVNSELLEIFFQTVHKKISHSYNLISHNSDTNITKKELSYLDDKIMHWYAQNLCVKSSDKISFIPIGLENLRRLKNGRKKWFSKPNQNKKSYILSSFNIFTNYQERSEINNKLNGNKLITIKNFESTREYFSELNNHKFVICPVGNGVDTHRIWESLLLNVIPILKISEFTKNLKKINIPALYISDWHEINNLNEEYLDNIYNSYSSINFQNFVTLKFWKSYMKKI